MISVAEKQRHIATLRKARKFKAEEENREERERPRRYDEALLGGTEQLQHGDKMAMARDVIAAPIEAFDKLSAPTMAQGPQTIPGILTNWGYTEPRVQQPVTGQQRALAGAQTLTNFLPGGPILGGALAGAAYGLEGANSPGELAAQSTIGAGIGAAFHGAGKVPGVVGAGLDHVANKLDYAQGAGEAINAGARQGERFAARDMGAPPAHTDAMQYAQRHGDLSEAFNPTRTYGPILTKARIPQEPHTPAGAEWWNQNQPGMQIQNAFEHVQAQQGRQLPRGAIVPPVPAVEARRAARMGSQAPELLGRQDRAPDYADSRVQAIRTERTRRGSPDEEFIGAFEARPEVAAAREAANAVPRIPRDAPERAAFREETAAKIYGNGSPTKGKRADIVIGVAGSGKSSVVVDKIVNEHGSLLIDADVAKQAAPEWNKGAGASALHEESIAIRDAVLKRAIDNGDNFVMSTTGYPRSYGDKSTAAYVEHLARLGYEPHVHYVELPPAKAAERVMSGYLKGERHFVEPRTIFEMAERGRTAYSEAKPGARTYAHWNNDVPYGAEPILVERGGAGGGAAPAVGDGPGPVRPDGGDGGTGSGGGGAPPTAGPSFPTAPPDAVGPAPAAQGPASAGPSLSLDARDMRGRLKPHRHLKDVTSEAIADEIVRLGDNIGTDTPGYRVEDEGRASWVGDRPHSGYTPSGQKARGRNKARDLAMKRLTAELERRGNAEQTINDAFTRRQQAASSNDQLAQRDELGAPPHQPESSGADPFDLFSNPVGPALSLLKTRAGSTAAMAGLGYGMSNLEDEKLAGTGRFMVGLAALHGVGVKRIAGAGRAVGRAAVGAMKESAAGTQVLDAVSHDILIDPKVQALVQSYEQTVAKGQARSAELSKAARDLGPAGDRGVSDVIEGEQFEPLTPTDKVALGVAQKIADEFTALGESKVNAGLLSPETVAKRRGKYLPRMYAEHLAGEGGGATHRQGDAVRIRSERTREDLTPEYRNELGEIREASFRTAQGVDKGYRNVAAAELFKGLKEIPDAIHPDFTNAVDALTAAKRAGDPFHILQAKRELAALSAQVDGYAGYERLPDTDALGVLRGVVVKKEIANYLNGVPELTGKPGYLLTLWKRIHTVLNPGTHVGNTMSNSVQAHMAGLPLTEQPKALRAALLDYNRYGPTTRTLAESGVLERGLPTRTDAVPVGGRPLKEALGELAQTTRPETRRVLAQKGIEPPSKMVQKTRAAGHGMEALYAKEDGVYRVALYDKVIAEGMDPKAALDFVDRAFVNYKTRSPLMGFTKTYLSPFIMYPARAIPFIAGQIVEHPWRWMTLAAAWGGLDQYSQHKVGEIAQNDLPRRLRTNRNTGYGLPGFTQLPFKGEKGEKFGIDVARWTPFSAMTGAPAPGTTAHAIFGDDAPAALSPSGPLWDIGARLSNTDPFSGDKIIKPGASTGDKVAAVAKGAASLALPSALSFHAPRIGGDLANRDPRAAATDALGLAGMRPQVVRPGMQAYRERIEFSEARNQIILDLRRKLRANKDPQRRDAIIGSTQERLRQLAQDFRSSRAGSK